MEHLAFCCDSSPEELCRDLGAKDEVVIPEVPDPDDEAKLPVPHVDDGVVAEDDCPASVPGSGELGEDEADHEGLYEAAEDGLEGHEDHGVGALGGGLAGSITDRVLRLQGEQEARGKVGHMLNTHFLRVAFIL